MSKPKLSPLAARFQGLDIDDFKAKPLRWTAVNRSWPCSAKSRP
jgi:hypothetical protein